MAILEAERSVVPRPGLPGSLCGVGYESGPAMVKTVTEPARKEIAMASDNPAQGEPEYVSSDVLGAEAGGTDELGAEAGGTDVLGAEAGGTDELGAEAGGTDVLGAEAGGTDVLGHE